MHPLPAQPADAFLLRSTSTRLAYLAPAPAYTAMAATSSHADVPTFPEWTPSSCSARTVTISIPHRAAGSRASMVRAARDLTHGRTTKLSSRRVLWNDVRTPLLPELPRDDARAVLQALSVFATLREQLDCALAAVHEPEPVWRPEAGCWQDIHTKDLRV